MLHGCVYTDLSHILQFPILTIKTIEDHIPSIMFRNIYIYNKTAPLELSTFLTLFQSDYYSQNATLVLDTDDTLLYMHRD